MSPFKIDMSDVGEGFDPIPAGAYPVVASSLRQSEEDGPSGYPYIIVELTVADGEFENRKLWTNLSMSPRAAFKVKEFLLSVGLSEEEIGVEEFEFDPDAYEGATLDVAVKQESYEGVVRNKVTNFIPAEEAAAPKKAAPKGKKSFR